VLQAGEVLPETVETIHRGFITESPVELLVFYAGDAGMPLFSVHYRANRRMTERSDEVSENTSRSAEVNDVSEVFAFCDLTICN
jgi:hypothetical protein